MIFFINPFFVLYVGMVYSSKPNYSSSYIRSWTKLPRLFCSDIIEIGKYANLDPDSIHYLTVVMRQREGDEFRVFNSYSGEYLCKWIAKKSVQANERNAAKQARSRKSMENIQPVVISQLRIPEAEQIGKSYCSLYFAPIKPARLKAMLESCTELGVREFVPVITERTQYKLDDNEKSCSIEGKSFKSPQLIGSPYWPQLKESTEQSELLYIPKIAKSVPLAQLLNDWDDGLTLFVCRERLATCNPSFSAIAAESIQSNMNRISSLNSSKVDKSGVGGILIGPEGGFSDAELDQLGQKPFVRFVSLGPSVLRAGTAAAAAVSILYDVLRGHYHAQSNVKNASNCEDDSCGRISVPTRNLYPLV